MSEYANEIEQDESATLPPEPVEDTPEDMETRKIDFKIDTSWIKLALVRSNNRLFRIDPKDIETNKEYKFSLVTIDNGFALVDLDKHKIRPFLLSILGQYNILPELKRLDQIWMISIFSAVMIFAGFFINWDGGKIDELGKKLDAQTTVCKKENANANLVGKPLFASGSTVNRKLWADE